MSSITGGNYIQLQNIENTNDTAEQFASQQSDIDNNTLNITENTNNIAQNTLDISQNTYDVSQNKYDITLLNGRVTQNVIDISQNTYDVSQNKYDITLLNGRVTQNEIDISNNDMTHLEPRVTQNETDIASNTTKLSGITYYSPSDTTIIYNRLKIEAPLETGVSVKPQLEIRNTATDPNNQVNCTILVAAETDNWSNETDEGDILYLCRKYNLLGNTYTGSFLITRHGNSFTGAKISMDPVGTTKIVTGTCEITADLVVNQKILKLVDSVSLTNNNSQIWSGEKNLRMKPATNDGQIRMESGIGPIAYFGDEINLHSNEVKNFVCDNINSRANETIAQLNLTARKSGNDTKSVNLIYGAIGGGSNWSVDFNNATLKNYNLSTPPPFYALCRIKINSSNNYVMDWKSSYFIAHPTTGNFVDKISTGNIQCYLDPDVVPQDKYNITGNGRQYGDADTGSGRAVWISCIYKGDVYHQGSLYARTFHIGLNRSFEPQYWIDLIYTNSTQYGVLDLTVNWI